jgi:hypothetical protein
MRVRENADWDMLVTNICLTLKLEFSLTITSKSLIYDDIKEFLEAHASFCITSKNKLRILYANCLKF